MAAGRALTCADIGPPGLPGRVARRCAGAAFSAPPRAISVSAGHAAACSRDPIGVFQQLSVMLDLAAFARLTVRNSGPKSRERSCARVAERQTRWLQVPVSERAWGFKSPLAHAM
jgi:hypothetical protein